MSRYTERVAQQRCGRCGKQDDNTFNGHSLCYECTEKRNAALKKSYYKHHEERKKTMRERTDWLKSKGICIACGREKAREGLCMCQACATKNSLNSKRSKTKKERSAEDG
jgi:NMD protein affecting ribosome stability and mRNA decay